MCGISGFYSKQNRFTEQELRLANTCMAHRGPDADGFYFSENKQVGLGHRRLSILDLSTAANQPMFSHNGRYVMVFNGEVYNFKEIAARLDIHTNTTSDTEVILEAFARKGPECVHLFNGMFAIAIYDTGKDEMYLLRDRLGVKPLYYFEHENAIAFSSEMKALRQLKYVKDNTTVYKPAIATFLYSGYIPEPYTIYTNVRKLPAGSYAVVKNGVTEIKSYWKPEERIRPQVLSDYGQAKAELKELLTSSVKYRMISDVPFGTFLSGGIDSSIVTAMAQSVSAEPVKTFSIGFKEAKYNESEYARAVAKHLGTNHHEFTVTENDALQLMDRMLEAYDEPYADSSAIPTMLVSKLARQHVTMTLSGDGGDELFLGYGAYNWAKRLNNPRLKTWRKPAAALLSLLPSRYKRAGTVINYPTEERIKSHIFSQEQYFFSEAELNKMLLPVWQAEPLFNEQFKTARKLSVAEEQALYDVKYYLKDDLLTKVDIASMQFSLEVRTPFLDYRVVEFALNLDETLRKKEGVAKYLLKEVLYDYVPKAMFDRPKWGFSIPLVHWLKNELRYLLDKYLSDEAVAKAGVLKPETVKAIRKRFEAGDDYLYNRLWVLLVLHKWLLQADNNTQVV